MDNKIVTRKITNAIFLAAILLAGTFAAISPSFILKGVNAQAGLEYYDGMDNRYNSYGPIQEYPSKYTDKNSYGPTVKDYEMDDNNNRKSYETNSYETTTTGYGMDDNSYEKSQYPSSSYKTDYQPKYQTYGVKDNSYKPQKDSSSKSVSINKLKCINNNVNINGNNTGDINIGNKGAAEGYLGGGYSSYGSGYDSEGYSKQGKGFDCIINNNNNNTNVVSGGGNVTDGNGNGNGNVNTCDENVRACFDAQLNDAELEDLEDVFPFQTTIIQPDPQPSITITIQSLDDFCEALQETLGAQNISILTIVVDEILQQAEIVITSAELQGLIRCIAEALGIETSIRLVETADSDGSPIAPNINIDNTDFNTNTATSTFDINTAGDMAPSFSSPPTISQETQDLSALEKITKLKQQWLDLLP